MGGARVKAEVGVGMNFLFSFSFFGGLRLRVGFGDVEYCHVGKIMSFGWIYKLELKGVCVQWDGLTEYVQRSLQMFAYSLHLHADP